MSVAPLQDEALRAEIMRAEVPQQRVAHRKQLLVVKLDRAVTVAQHQLADAHLNYEKGFRIQDCYFHDSRSRGILLSGACNGTVASNIWWNEVDGISIYEESWGYAEGPMPADITIEGNRILWSGTASTNDLVDIGECAANINASGNHLIGLPPHHGMIDVTAQYGR